MNLNVIKRRFEIKRRVCITDEIMRMCQIVFVSPILR